MSERVHTATTLAFVGAILSITIGVIYLLAGIGLMLSAWTRGLGVVFLILGIIALTGGVLTWMMAKPKLVQGDLKTGFIMCFIFGGLTSYAVGGILTIVAGILTIIAWSEQKQVSPPPPPPPPS